jgi:AraC family transcriptional regulator
MTGDSHYLVEPADFFRFRVSRPALAKALRKLPVVETFKKASVQRSLAAEGIVFGLTRNLDAQWNRSSDRPVNVVPFPDGMRALVNIAVDPEKYGPPTADDIPVLLPRVGFDQLAERYGTSRVQRFSLAPGLAADDAVANSLGKCLSGKGYGNAFQTDFEDNVGSALNLHFAMCYGGMRLPKTFSSGGLAPWQLRLAISEINTNLTDKILVEALAKKCGLSAGHFARAFTLSVGSSPHRFMMQRRVALAKSLIGSTDLALVEIGLQCGFSDQSHFNRVFSSLTSITPGRWRGNPQLREALASCSPASSA